MSKIRSDVAGVVLARDSTSVVWLRAGDEVPAGVTVDPDLLEGGETEAVKPAKRGGRRAAGKSD
ncbi:hypothetical protein G7Y31_06680 [Corynebacterium lizhenjunii]|uniref:Uncharacterized protein n=1 Tax=Corynebacterium lizhenjunii TaxID=2709394 RepID=A0A7T0PAE1_9CORY|nr:hypothetical protein [Corynebacterium lizhenjunii]QPK78270.1 hypothetical protein G7Y31_06680 [Corynebacterium lizhenjunii]